MNTNIFDGCKYGGSSGQNHHQRGQQAEGRGGDMDEVVLGKKVVREDVKAEV